MDAFRFRRAAGIVVSFYIMLLTVGVYLALGWPFDSGLQVSREGFGPAWPLTASEGIVRCEVGREITFHTDGTTYTLNGLVAHGGYSDISGLLADDSHGGKRDLRPLIERGTELCH